MSPDQWIYAAVGTAGAIVLVLAIVVVALPGKGRNAMSVEQVPLHNQDVYREAPPRH